MKFKFGITSALLSFAVAQFPAGAMMLHGGVQQSSATLPQQSQNLIAAGISASNGDRADRAKVLQGSWHCTSQVVGSNVPGVVAGTVVHSMVRYAQDNQGNMIESWFQNNWSPAISAVIKLDSAVLTSSRESTSPSSNGDWSARCRDIYKIVSPEKMISESVVQQFVNGQFVGSYKTRSVLLKTGA